MRGRWGVSAAAIFVALSVATIRLMPDWFFRYRDLELAGPAAVVLLGLIAAWPHLSPHFPEGDSWAALFLAASCAAAGALLVTFGYVRMRYGAGHAGASIILVLIGAGPSLVATPVAFISPRIFDPELRPVRSRTAA